MAIRKYTKAQSIVATKIALDGTTLQNNQVKNIKMSKKKFKEYVEGIGKREIKFISKEEETK
ncbi:hypothetical protein SDC9_37757 [bioreactor metagenome]|uniref:Uncharacterized protein n=1 Tax=bioreactor metagenome TaxID=1076179 RepID=A0A644VK45_9ZZZZ